MIKKLIFVVLLTAGLIGGYWGFKQYQIWKQNRPTQENFDRITKEILNKQENVFHFNFGYYNENCIAVPTYPQPDNQSKSRNPLAWHLDFFVDAVNQPQRTTQLKKLNALVDAGLLSRSQTVVEAGESLHNVLRYKMTEKGWLESTRSRDYGCFGYGTPHYLGVTRFEPLAVANQSNFEIYQVYFQWGIGNITDLHAWAQLPQVQAEFPQILADVKGEQRSVQLARGRGEWVDQLSMQREALLEKYRLQHPESADLNQGVSKEMQKDIDRKNAQPLPTEAEVRKIITEQFVPMRNCLPLPGEQGFPVDQELSREWRDYRIAIAKDIQRPSYDRTEKDTIPYINDLVQAGILEHAPDDAAIQGKGIYRGQTIYASVYQISEQYKARFDSKLSNCLSFGNPAPQILFQKIIEFPRGPLRVSSFSYKMRVRFPDAPDWMKSQDIQTKLPIIRAYIQEGIACEGNFEFDKETRRGMAGSGSCWPTFDTPSGH